MATRCAKCGKEVAAEKVNINFEDQFICDKCNNFLRNTPKKYHFRNIEITLGDLGLQEEIAKKGNFLSRTFTLRITNKHNLPIEWISVDLIIQSSERKTSGSSRIVNGNTQYRESEFDLITTQKVNYLFEDAISPQGTSYYIYRISCRLPFEQYRELDLYEMRGKFLNGETFSHRLYYKEKMDFDANGYHYRESSQSCFVTTAAFGDSNHPMVVEFRNFRDNRLSHTAFGRKFIQWYNLNGPTAAQFIKNRPAMKFITRLILWPLAMFIRLLRNAENLCTKIFLN